VLAAAGAADLLLSRLRLARALRMTRAEVERDLREDEGDPRWRAERRRSHADPPPLGAPPRPVCVVVNPTRIAVALGHRRGSDEAPVVLAKRAGPAAASLRREARRSGLPVVRDAALARALWSLAEVGESIPEELYDAAAAVLASVYALPLEART
jgi:flagellar biosynthesis protein FlhB